MTSTRLPGKVLKEVLGKSLLEFQIERLKRVRLADEIVIATTINDTDQPIVDLCKKLDVRCFRGSEEDVLSRYYLAAVQYCAEVIVRITSDCPLIDPDIVNQVISLYLENNLSCEYASNIGTRSYPRGMDTEVFSLKSLTEANSKALLPAEREHVTPYIRLHSEKFMPRNLRNKEDKSQHRWTVDTTEDYELIKKIIEVLYLKKHEFTMQDCLDILAANPSWIKINQHIEQKAV